MFRDTIIFSKLLFDRLWWLPHCLGCFRRRFVVFVCFGVVCGRCFWLCGGLLVVWRTRWRSGWGGNGFSDPCSSRFSLVGSSLHFHLSLSAATGATSCVVVVWGFVVAPKCGWGPWRWWWFPGCVRNAGRDRPIQQERQRL